MCPLRLNILPRSAHSRAIFSFFFTHTSHALNKQTFSWRQRSWWHAFKHLFIILVMHTACPHNITSNKNSCQKMRMYEKAFDTSSRKSIPIVSTSQCQSFYLKNFFEYLNSSHLAYIIQFCWLHIITLIKRKEIKFRKETQFWCVEHK